MRPFRRTADSPDSHVSWAADVIELGAVFVAAGLAHLFVGMVGHHADGAAILVVSGAALIAVMLLHRWWSARHRTKTAATRARVAVMQDLLSVPAGDRNLLRLRTTLPDRPGSLAALSGQLARLDVNILAIQVHPNAHSAVDDLLIAAPRAVTSQQVIAAVEAGGGTRTRAGHADAHDLVDPATRALSLTARVLREPTMLHPALLSLLSADAMAVEPGSFDPATTAKLHGPDGQPLYVSRPALAFTPTELSRAQALINVCAQARVK
ncbi:hypothetical protein BJY16_007311 [Actinoplanes octamycinicus]|uniref:ACT domain-containing protein n=1 Tax=Actinoplanes octamycinicus TaxID=135948 RepID=A0A7W7MBB7_9ACTN|nr:hypothetical protein [Actinoplanes octamycinicus]MBB4743852.1 hypothetical protein [Actinoplanes octamycinicus]GIE58481.1 hypothetical protein Aoc01nite_38830 [Actinoplanes octamycinicus]